MTARCLVVATMVLLATPVLLPAQILVPAGPGDRAALPQKVVIYPPIHPPIHRPIRPFPRPTAATYAIRSLDVQANVHDQVAKIRMSQVFHNTGSTTLEATFLFPLPVDAAISDLTLLYDGKELPGKLLDKDQARRIYEEIVRRQRDPALMEFVGHGLYQTSVFPIPPNADRTVEIRYSQLLKKMAGLSDLLVPLGTFKQGNRPIEKLTVGLRLETTEAIKTVYSPTHSVDIQRPDEHHATGKLELKNVSAPDDLRIFCGTHSGPVGMSLISYRPKESEDGYFMLLASPELKAPAVDAVPKTVLIVVDRSGSMSGEKIEQVRQAVKFLLRQLKPADTFNIIAYDSEVEAFRPELQRATPPTIQAGTGFTEGLNAGGGTNIDGALKTAFSMLVDQKRPSYVLFLTDGVPTVGEQNEMKIVAAAKEADKVHARLFNFGVGFDVNSRLLDRLSNELAGQSVYVRPNENIETHVSTLAKTIGAPLLTNIDVKFDFDKPVAAGSTAAITQTYPRKLTDLFLGEQLVWVGRYRQAGPVKITLSGELAGKRQSFTLTGKLNEHAVGDGDSFVAKVWATRRIGELIDEIDLHGKNQELTDELVQLSLKHGILTPYTSFLADEHVDLADRRTNLSRASGNLRALRETEGVQSFALRANKGNFKAASRPAAAQTYGYAQSVASPATPVAGSMLGFDSTSVAGQVAPNRKTTVLNVGPKTFYWKNDRWRDADVTAEAEKNPTRIKQFSDEYFALVRGENARFAKYLGLDGPVLVSLDGKTYLIEAQAGE